jgi:hypothetical protein
MALAVERNCGRRAVVDLHFEIAPRIVSRDIVKDQYEVVHRHPAALRQRHEDIVATTQIGETQTVDEADIRDRHLGEEAVRPRRRGDRFRERRRCRRGRVRPRRCRMVRCWR